MSKSLPFLSRFDGGSVVLDKMKICRFCVHFDNYGDHGDCHARAPVIAGNATHTTKGSWPSVRPHDTCGDFKPNFEKIAEQRKYGYVW